MRTISDLRQQQDEQLCALGKLSVELFRAQLEVDAKKAAYHAAWRNFELEGDDPILYGRDEYRITRDSEQWDEVIAATHVEYMAWQKAKKEANNIKARWLRACRKIKP